MDYYKISFKTNNAELIDILSYELGEIGFESFDDDGFLFNAYIQNDLFDEQKLISVCNIYDKNLINHYKKVLIPSQNWNASWESNYEPIEISSILRIRANFHLSKPEFVNEIVINPKMSFGTGHHETTQLVAKTMSSLNFANAEVLDMGCGTGILAIYAEKLGAGSIYAIDIEDFAFENAIENIALNKCQNIHVEKGGIEKIPPRSFNIILANINKNILLQQLPTYSNHLTNGGTLILSGFFENDCDELLKTGLLSGMEFVSKKTSNNWACLNLRKR